MKPIIITGGAGYIGTHVARECADQGYLPIVIDKNWSKIQGWRLSKNLQPLPWNFIEDDCRNLDNRVLTLTNGLVPKTIIHLAGSIDVKESMEKPMDYFYNNTSSTIDMLQRAKRMGVESVIFASTAAVYNGSNPIRERKYEPFSEDSKLNPQNIYGISKLLSEEVIKNSGLRYSIFRFFNAAGASEDSMYGEHHDPETHLIPNIFQAIKENRPVNIFGDKYHTKDGTCVRDYIHVKDIAKAHIKALDYMNKTNNSGIYNLGNWDGISIMEILNTVEEVTGIQVKWKISKNRPGDSAMLIANTSRANEILDWYPEFSDIKTIIKDAWNWFQVI